MACEVDEFKIESLILDSVIRGYHVYKDVWESNIGEVLQCRHDAHNHRNPLAFGSGSEAEMSTLWKYLNRDIG